MQQRPGFGLLGGLLAKIRLDFTALQ